MALRCQYEGQNDIGVFSLLTNGYCLVSIAGCQNFYSTFEGELADKIPVIRTSISGIRTLGCLCAGNSKGLLLPHTTQDTELMHLKNSLPDNVKLLRLEERLSALGNVILCNDYCAVVHPDLDKETQELVADTLGVEVFPSTVGEQVLVGTYARITNRGGLIAPPSNAATSVDILNELSSLLQIPLVAGTVNRGSPLIASGCVANDWIAFCGMATTSTEVAVMESIFGLDDVAGAAQASGSAAKSSGRRITGELRSTLLDDM